MSVLRQTRTTFSLILAALAALVAGGVVALHPSVSAATTAPCGSVTYYKSVGKPWVCSFADEFNATTLDTSKWTAFASEAGGFRGGDECYSPGQVSLAGGLARITASKAAAPFDCAGKQAAYRSGMITTRGKFAQTYGRFEMRAKIPTQIGLQGAFWLLPQNPYRADGIHYGEIDVMENWGAYPSLAAAHLHYVNTPGTPQLGKYCTVPNMSLSYHTYAVTWTPTSMTFAYDGITCWKTTWTTIPGYQPAGATAPEPFNQPFYLIINLGVGSKSYTPGNVPSSSTTFPTALLVDHIRVWK